MTKIVLKPMPGTRRSRPICVGTAADIPFAYEGRQALIGDKPVEHSAIAEDLLQAIEDALAPAFGGDWPKPLSVITGANSRTVQRDRILKKGIAADSLVLIGRIAALAAESTYPRAIGDLMMATARLLEPYEAGTLFPRTKPWHRDYARITGTVLLGKAADVVGEFKETLGLIRERD